MIKDILIDNELTSLVYISDIGFYPKANGHYRIRKEIRDDNDYLCPPKNKNKTRANLNENLPSF